MASLQDLFAFRNISKAIDVVKGGIPALFPPAMETITEKVLGNETTFHTHYGQRKLITRTEYAAPAKVYNQQKIGQKGIVLSSFAGKVQVEQELVLRLRQENDLLAQDRAKDVIARATTDFVQRFKNNRIAHFTQLLSKGVFWYGATGALQQSSSNAVVTVDMGVPAINQNQLNGIISASWATASTDIYTQMVNLKKTAVQTTGRPLKYAFYGANIPGYIFKNDSFKYYFNYNPQYFQAFTNNPGEIPNGFMGLDWRPMQNTFYTTGESGTDTVVELFAGDQVTFTPEIDSDVYTMYEGSVVVPTKMGIGAGDLDIALQSSEVKYGMYGFSKFTYESSLNAELIYGDTFAPMWKSPLDMYIADVTP